MRRGEGGDYQYNRNLRFINHRSHIPSLEEANYRSPGV